MMGDSASGFLLSEELVAALASVPATVIGGSHSRSTEEGPEVCREVPLVFPSRDTARGLLPVSHVPWCDSLRTVPCSGHTTWAKPTSAPQPGSPVPEPRTARHVRGILPSLSELPGCGSASECRGLCPCSPPTAPTGTGEVGSALLVAP